MRKNKHALGFLSIITLIMVLNNASSITSDMTYVFTINYKDGEVSPESLDLFDAAFSEFSNGNEGSYRADLVDGNNILYSVKFGFELVMLPSISAECIDIETGEVVCDIFPSAGTAPYVILNFPYFENADSINVYKGTELLFSYPLPSRKAAFNYLLLLAPSSLIIILVILALFKKNKSTKNLYRKRYPQLENYITTSLSNGFSKKQLKEALLKAGYKKDLIGKLL